MNTIPKKDTIDKASQFGFGLTFKSSNQNDYPVAYQDDIWDVADENTKLKELMGQVGQYDQHTINEELAKEIQTKLTEEDLQEIKVDNVVAQKSIIGVGGSVEFEEGSSMVVKKGDNEMKVVVDDGETTDELTIPQKTGTIAIDEDIPFENGDSAFSARQKQETGKENVASKQGSFAGGESSQALGKNSFAFGDHVTSIGDGAFACGSTA